jgi:hypothetical protein
VDIYKRFKIDDRLYTIDKDIVKYRLLVPQFNEFGGGTFNKRSAQLAITMKPIMPLNEPGIQIKSILSLTLFPERQPADQ